MADANSKSVFAENKDGGQSVRNIKCPVAPREWLCSDALATNIQGAILGFGFGGCAGICKGREVRVSCSAEVEWTAAG